MRGRRRGRRTTTFAVRMWWAWRKMGVRRRREVRGANLPEAAPGPPKEIAARSIVETDGQDHVPVPRVQEGSLRPAGDVGRAVPVHVRADAGGAGGGRGGGGPAVRPGAGVGAGGGEEAQARDE